MTVGVTSSRVQYVGDGSQVEYAFLFRIFENDNLKVYIDNVLQTLDTDYTVVNNGDETGGTVTFDTAPANASIIAIERILEMQQVLDLIAYDRFPAESVEEALDRLTYLIQQNDAAMERALQVGQDAPDTTDFTFPNPGDGEFIRFTSDGTALETADITELSPTVVPTATNAEITTGTETATRLVSPAQIKLSVETHETADITDINNVQWVEVVTALPGTPDANTLYLVKE
jgi:hypothetical protein